MRVFSRVLMVAVVMSVGAEGASACSAAACLNNGFEVRPNFSVQIKFKNSPLDGATVHISGSGKDLTFSTASNGFAPIANLDPGTYWLDAQYLGIGAAYYCFHISEHPSRTAKRKLIYEWGDDAPATQKVVGRLVDSQPGKGGNPLWNLLHQVNVPIVGASLKLQSATSDTVFVTTSDEDGQFGFASAPDGTYVLHIEGGHAGDRGYDATDQLLRVSSRATRNDLVFTRRQASGGSCGGTELELKNAN